jgi:hypothetical protein
MTTSPLIKALLSILENPWSEKGYKQLKMEYEKIGMTHEAVSLQALIKKKFPDVNDSTINKEQSEDS